MVSEHQVISAWRKLFKGGTITDDTIREAEKLLEDLSLESPLRHRLGGELEEISARLQATVEEE